MGLPARKYRLTAAEYLDAEHEALERHEFHDGEMLAMAGSTFEHETIATNLIVGLKNRLDGTGCRVLSGNMRVRPGTSSQFVYPDVSVICGAVQFATEDRRRTTITNPKVVIEVQSPSTERYDRTDKFSLYRESPHLEEYVMVAQDRPLVEAFLRREDGTWSVAFFEGLDAVARLRSLDVELPLSELYEGVEFPTPTNGPPADAD